MSSAMFLGELSIPFLTGQFLLRTGSWPLPWVVFGCCALCVITFCVLMFFVLGSQDMKQIAEAPITYTEEIPPNNSKNGYVAINTNTNVDSESVTV
jgi:uncharacterized membrane protein